MLVDHDPSNTWCQGRKSIQREVLIMTCTDNALIYCIPFFHVPNGLRSEFLVIGTARENFFLSILIL